MLPTCLHLVTDMPCHVADMLGFGLSFLLHLLDANPCTQGLVDKYKVLVVHISWL